jgi:mevalonate kinase
MEGRIYPGKIILFGEYTVINGGEVLAIPASFTEARWSSRSGNFDIDTSLLAFATYLIKHDFPFLDIPLMIEEINSGLFLKSTIPQGYGAGSSGALVAAVFDRYNKYNNQFSLKEIKGVFSQMESFFHGKSSGIDPLVSFFNQPLRIGIEGIELLDNDFSELLKKFYIIDSGIAKNTAEYVDIFKNNMKDDQFRSHVQSLSELVRKAINCMIIDQDASTFVRVINKISELQWNNFRPMIPLPIKPLWKKCLKRQDTAIKLCGSGGGGYFLAYTSNPDILGPNAIPLF